MYRPQVALAAANTEGGVNFAAPITEEIAPGYAKLIKRPMDLGTVSARLDAGNYAEPGSNPSPPTHFHVILKLGERLPYHFLRCIRYCASVGDTDLWFSTV